MARISRRNSPFNTSGSRCEEPLFKVGAYVRLSVNDKKQEGNSIVNQQSIINAYINANANMRLVEVYIDNGQTGQSFARPAFNQMIADAKSGKINCCITKDLSRLGRNAIDTGYYIEKYFPKEGIRFIAINENYDTADINCDGVMISLRNMMNEAYALEIGRKVRQTKQMQMSKGLFVGRLAPYGYLKDSQNKYLLVPDAYAASIVRNIFKMAADRKSVSEIVRWLNSNGILPPRRYFHKIGLVSEKEASGHIHWNRNVLYTLLQNQIYCGDMVQRKSETHSYAKKSLSKHNRIVVLNTHEAVISRELYELVQVINNKNRSKNCYKHSMQNIFIHKLYCGHCGYSLKREHNHEKNPSFVCATNRIYNQGDCVNIKISEQIIKSLLSDIIKLQASLFLNSPALMTPLVNRSEQQSTLRKQRKLQAEMKKLEFVTKDLYESIMKQIITIEEYMEQKAANKIKMDALAKEEKKIRMDIQSKTVSNDEVSDLLGASSLTAAVIGKLIERILFYNDNHIEIRFKFYDGFYYEQSNKTP